MNFRISLLGFVWLCCFSSGLKADDKIILWDRSYERPEFIELLTIALELTQSEYGSYSIEPSRPMEQGTAFAIMTRSDQLNVIIAGTSKEREKQHQTIYIPIDKGLLGFRICLVKEKNRHAFANVNTLSDINKLGHSIGIGTHWPDRKIIEANGLKTIHSELRQNLFNMLEFDRFSCFLRSVDEIGEEITANQHRNFTDEQHIALLYPEADFIFVGKKEKRLKERLEKGLLEAIENGDFDRHFDRHYMHALEKYNFFNRKLLFMSNPDISRQAKDAINYYGLASFAD